MKFYQTLFTSSDSLARVAFPAWLFAHFSSLGRYDCVCARLPLSFQVSNSKYINDIGFFPKLIVCAAPSSSRAASYLTPSSGCRPHREQLPELFAGRRSPAHRPPPHYGQPAWALVPSTDHEVMASAEHSWIAFPFNASRSGLRAGNMIDA
ncbi:hypothetical protein BC826DRAFT_695761 [Russula brevipes]|nr:hypothetical protein BC826DRAFT_695761 [Russula brevipes]